ncbi:hypothetical protein ACFYU8_18655 [Brevibacillus sp. NPDC003359]|uniref:hypothetical protein n=1 Tax=unclassified Brevibacillus TaxID=2684853 RepID=UPI0036CED4DF
MKEKRLFEWSCLLSALIVIPTLIVTKPQYYESGVLILLLLWLTAYLIFFKKTE